MEEKGDLKRRIRGIIDNAIKDVIAVIEGGDGLDAIRTHDLRLVKAVS